MPLRLALIDNYDSYTHNLAHLLAIANDGHAPLTVLADAYPSLDALRRAHGPFDAVILSPGPGTPTRRADFPQLPADALRTPNLPLLGVCLGHQALCHQAGATIARLPAGPRHGVQSVVQRAPASHDCPLLRGLPPTFSVVRYHSLAAIDLPTSATPSPLWSSSPSRPPSADRDVAPPPAAVIPTAWADDVDQETGKSYRVLMAVRARAQPRFGVQFHPESVASQFGLRIAANFLTVAAAVRAAAQLRQRIHFTPDKSSNSFAVSCNRDHGLIASVYDDCRDDDGNDNDNDSHLGCGMTPPEQSQLTHSSSVQRRPKERYRALVFERKAPNCDAPVIFDSLLGKIRPTFWLDSSTADRRNLPDFRPTNKSQTTSVKAKLAPMRDSVARANSDSDESLNEELRQKDTRITDATSVAKNPWALKSNEHTFPDTSTDSSECHIQINGGTNFGASNGLDDECENPQTHQRQTNEDKNSSGNISKTSGPGRAWRPRGRFSVMGPFKGPLTEVITYDGLKQEITERKISDGSISKLRGTIFDYLEQHLWSRHAAQPEGLPIELNGGYIGYLGYEVKCDVDGVRGNEHKSTLPDAWFIFADRLLVLDHAEDRLFLVALVPVGDATVEMNAREWFRSMDEQLNAIEQKECSHGVSEAQKLCERRTQRRQQRQSRMREESNEQASIAFTLERRRDEYIRDIEDCLESIRDGETYEVCLTNRLRTTLREDEAVDALDVYRELRRSNAAPYSAYLRMDEDTAVCCSSPERFLQMQANGRVESKPIKGTVKRGSNAAEDEQLREMLRSSEKERAENLMIVDLVRNDLSRACQVGSVRVPKLMRVESYATVHQLVSTVEGQLEEQHGGAAVRCVRAAYPMGSMTGAPKVRTMEIIDSTERSARGVYSGTLGFLAASGAGDLNVVIRTAVMRGRSVEIGVGGAIVGLSNAASEFDEIVLKGAAVMRAIATTATGSGENYSVK